MGRAVLKAIACAIAGTVAWMVCEPFFPKVVPIGRWTADPAFLRVELIFTLLLGALIGVTSGFLNGVERGGKSNILLASGLGLIFGAMGSSFGQSMAAGVYQALGGSNMGGNVIARTVAFMPLGLAIGAAVGASQRSFRTVKSGAVGGLIAGFITGAVFDTLSVMISKLTQSLTVTQLPMGYTEETGAPGRAVLAFGMGLLIGLFTALADLATRKAWVRLVLGRNEGREWPIDSAQTLIGRDERAHVPLFGDPQVPALAAVIVKQGGQYILQDPGSPIGIGHNGVRVQQAVLSRGDTIQIGSLNLQFLMKAGAASANEGRAKAVPMVGNWQQPPTALPPSQPAPLTPIQPTGPQQTMAYASQQAMTTPAALTLIVVSGPLTGQRVPVSGPVEIGREGSGLALGYDAQASRRHASLAPSSGGIQVTDLGSTNGTYVNGQRVQTAVIRSGDQLVVGSTTFKVE